MSGADTENDEPLDDAVDYAAFAAWFADTPRFASNDGDRERAAAYLSTFATPVGRRVLRDMCTAAGVFVPDAPDADLHRLAGRRDVILRILFLLSKR